MAPPSTSSNQKSSDSRYVHRILFSAGILSLYPDSPRLSQTLLSCISYTNLWQVYEPLLIIGLDKFANVDIRVRVTGGGATFQIYANRPTHSQTTLAIYPEVLA